MTVKMAGTMREVHAQVNGESRDSPPTKLKPNSTVAVDASCSLHKVQNRSSNASLLQAANTSGLTTAGINVLVTQAAHDMFTNLLALVDNDPALLRELRIICIIELGTHNDAKASVQAKRGDDEKVRQTTTTNLGEKKNNFFLLLFSFADVNHGEGDRADH